MIIIINVQIQKPYKIAYREIAKTFAAFFIMCYRKLFVSKILILEEQYVSCFWTNWIKISP